MTPDVLPTPKGLNVVGRHLGAVREPPLRLMGGREEFGLEGRGPWVSPTATDIVPPRGTWWPRNCRTPPRTFIADLFHTLYFTFSLL